MFDARSILDILIGGNPPRQGRTTNPSVFKDMLDQLGDQAMPPAADRRSDSEQQQVPGDRYTEQRYPQGPRVPAGDPSGGPGGSASLEDLLRSILTQIQPAQQQRQGEAPGAGQALPQPPPPDGPEIGKELQDLLRQILRGQRGGEQVSSGGAATLISRVMGEGGPAEPGEPGATADLAETFKQMLRQASAGAREGAARIDEVTGVSGKAREALGQATGQTPEELIARVRQLIAENQSASGAALGGLGALVLGTRAGRSLAATAIKLGGLALIGGLAYKAYQNYQQGKPPLATETEAKGSPQTLLPAPEGTGFEVGAVTHDAARRCIRAMIAAAASDGRIDTQEQQRLLAGLKQAGLDEAAEHFLAAEIANPANVAELASGISSPEEALQVYTAARMAVDPDAVEEHAFLSALAGALGIADELAAQVDAATRGAASTASG